MKVAAWQEWREKCAVAKCSDESSRELADFAGTRFNRYARPILGDHDLDADLPPPNVCFNLVEQWMSVARPRTGRRYKEWLFARVDAAPQRDAGAIISSGAGYIVRTVVRNWLKDHEPCADVSLDTPISSAEDMTLVDLLPDESSFEVEADMLRELADSLADEVFAAMERQTRLVMLARSSGLPLYHPLLLEEFGCGKTKASDTWKRVLSNIAELVKEKWPDEPIDWKKSLTMNAFDAIDRLLTTFDSDGEIRAHLTELARA